MLEMSERWGGQHNYALFWAQRYHLTLSCILFKFRFVVLFHILEVVWYNNHKWPVNQSCKTNCNQFGFLTPSQSLYQGKTKQTVSTITITWYQRLLPSSTRLGRKFSISQQEIPENQKYMHEKSSTSQVHGVCLFVVGSVLFGCYYCCCLLSSGAGWMGAGLYIKVHPVNKVNILQMHCFPVSLRLILLCHLGRCIPSSGVNNHHGFCLL